MPFPFLLGLLLGIPALLVLAFFAYQAWRAWYLERQKLVESDKDRIAIHVRTKLESGDYKVVQGIFNKRTNELEDVKATQAEKVDEEIKDVGKNNELVVLQ